MTKSERKGQENRNTTKAPLRQLHNDNKPKMSKYFSVTPPVTHGTPDIAKQQ